MATPADEANPSRSPRQARTLRSEQCMQDSHTPEAAAVLIAVRQLLVARFGEQGCLQQLAKLIRAESEGTNAAKTSRNIAKRLSEQLGNRAVKGPDWRTIEAVLRYCVADNQRTAEAARLQALFVAARGHQPAELSGRPVSRGGDNQEITALRAALRVAEQDAAKARQDLQTLAADQAVALRAAGNLTTRATEQEQKLTEAVRQVAELSARVDVFRSKYEDALSSSVRDRAELTELRERLARLVAFVESQEIFRNARVATSALPSTAQSVGIAPTSAAPPSLRAVSSYLRARAELGGYQVAAIAQETGLSPEVIERTFAAQALPAYPILAQIGVAVNADTDYLLDAFMRAETESTELRKTEVELVLPEDAQPSDMQAAFDQIVADYEVAAEPDERPLAKQCSEPRRHRDRPEAPARRNSRRYRGKYRRRNKPAKEQFRLLMAFAVIATLSVSHLIIAIFAVTHLSD